MFSLLPAKKVLLEILKENDLVEKPDGRPLYRYKYNSIRKREVKGFLKDRKRAFENGRADKNLCAVFVLYASIWYRENRLQGRIDFDKDFLEKELLFAKLKPKQRSEIIENGLVYWGRKVRQRENGYYAYIHSLIAQGGIPEYQLEKDGKFQKALIALVKDIEVNPHSFHLHGMSWLEGHFEHFSELYKNNSDFKEDFLNLAKKIADLREKAPENLNGQDLIQYLNSRFPDWQGKLPLPISSRHAVDFIHEVLKQKRPKKYLPAFRRELHFDKEIGVYKPYVHFEKSGFLPPDLFENLTDRFLYLEVLIARRMIEMEAVPLTEGGWSLRISGRQTNFPLPLSGSVVFAAWDDGEKLGEVEIISAMPEVEEYLSYWEEKDGGEETLILANQQGKTQKEFLYLLTPEDSILEPLEDVVQEGCFASEEGKLLKFSGKGKISFNEKILKISTKEEKPCGNLSFRFLGRNLPIWRTDQGLPVWLGEPLFLAQIGKNTPIYFDLKGYKTDWREGRTLFRKIAEGKEHLSGDDYASMGSLSGIFLPKDFEIEVKEVEAGKLAFRISALDGRFSVVLSAPHCEDAVLEVDAHSNAKGMLCCENLHLPPATCFLEIIENETNRSLKLQRNWPSLHPYLSNESGERISGGENIFLENLEQYFANGADGKKVLLEIQYKDNKHDFGQYPLTSPAPLSTFMDFLKRLLAQSGYDGELILKLGQKDKGLTLRRYRKYKKEDLLKETLFDICAIDISAFNEKVAVKFKITSAQWHDFLDYNLKFHLNETGKFILFAKGKDSIPLKAKFWSAHRDKTSTRKERIQYYILKWQEDFEKEDISFWQERIKTFLIVSDYGDLGALDEVQALASVPEAALLMILLARDTYRMQKLFSLDQVSPIFWGTVSLAAYKKALEKVFGFFIREEKKRLKVENFDAKRSAWEILAGRLKELIGVSGRQALGAHWGLALQQSSFFEIVCQNPAALGSEACEKLIITIEKENLLSKVREQANALVRCGAQDFQEMPQVSYPQNIIKSGIKEFFPKRTSVAKKIEDLLEAPFLSARLALTGHLEKISFEDRCQIQKALIFLRERAKDYFDGMLPQVLSAYANHPILKK